MVLRPDANLMCNGRSIAGSLSATFMDTSTEKPRIASHRPPGKMPSVPASWFHLCASGDLDRSPVSVELCGREFVGYRTEAGRAVVLAGRCSHLGAHLRNGTVNGDRLVCPLHGWEYGPDGLCQKIPAEDNIPRFAR
jgi:nitrite reductase/ring-hydroxylating ferredoxin subunit